MTENSRIALKTEECTFYRSKNIELDSSYLQDDLSDPGKDLVRKY
jgi:hypothetical protein